jgi:adenylate cyclase
VRLNLRDPAALHVGAGDFPRMRLNRLAPALYAIFNLTPPSPHRMGSSPMSQARVQRRLAAILFADVVGYSRLTGQDEVGTWQRLHTIIRDEVRPQIQGHDGRIIRIKGDGILVEFASAVEAVCSAVALQQAIARRNAALDPEQRIQLRIGINLGDIMSDDEDLHGDGVNVAARLEPLAEPGGICISATVHEHVRAKLPYRFEDRGKRMLKNIANPIWIYVLGPETIAKLPTAAPLRTGNASNSTGDCCGNALNDRM